MRSLNNVAALTEEGAFALFFGPHPGEFDSSRVSTPGNLPSKAKKMQTPKGQPKREGGGGLGAAGVSLEKHYSFRGPINDRISHGIDNKLNETYYTNYHLEFLSAKTCLLVQSH